MADVEATQCAALVLILASAEEEEKKRSKRKIWTRKWLARRSEASVFWKLVQELELEDEKSFRHFMRLDKQQFHEVLNLIRPNIVKRDTNMRKAVSPEERLAITLRHLATGESQSSLAYQFRVSQNLISSIIPEVCKAIHQALQPRYLKMPSTAEEWKEIARGFYSYWNYPHCLGAMDGKRILIEKPAKSGSEFYDYKGHFSVILMALVDYDYKFLYVDVGTNGRASDATVWNKCSLLHHIEGNRLNIPPVDTLPLSDKKCPYVIVGDDAFPLKIYLMKPYPGKNLSQERLVHNYRLSRARRTSENAFGILCSRFQIYRQPIRTSPDNVELIALATAALHNYLRVNSSSSYTPQELIDREDINNGRFHRGEWHNTSNGGMANLNAAGVRPNNNALEVRETFQSYFNGEGSVPWQDQMLLAH